MEKQSDDIYSNYSFLLERTSKKIKQYARQKFRENNFSVTVDQWAVLKILYSSSQISQVELSVLTQKDTPTLTRIIDLLSSKNLIERQADESDRRRLKLCLTPEGKQTVKKMLPKVKDIRMQAWQQLSESDFQHFIRILNKIYQNLDV